MSPKRLLPLVVILLVLGLLAVLLKRPPTSPKLPEEVGFERLAPQAFGAEAVSSIELFLGAQPQDVVRLRKREGTWLVSSHFDTPGNSTKIQQLLTQVSGLQGELRADAAALLEDFRLKDEQALHLKLYTDKPETPALYVLAGKSSGTNGFIRRSGEHKVYMVNLNLPSLAGMSSSGTSEQGLAAKPWLDLRLQNVPKEQVTAVELQAPTRTLRFTTTPAEAGQTAPPAWKLAAPTLAYEVQPEAVESLVSTLRTVQGDDVADPARVASYGLETPAYRATLTLQPSGQEAQQATLLVGAEVPEKSGSRYARLATGGPVYILPQWTWQRLFPTLGTLLDLRLLQAAEEDVMQVTLQQGGQTWSVQRRTAVTPAADSTAETADAWQFTGLPEAAVDAAAVTSLLGSVSQLKADDLPPTPPTSTGLEQPTLQVALTLRDGRTERLLVGQAVAAESGGYYASSSKQPDVLIIPATMQRTLTDAVTKLSPDHTLAKDAVKP